MTNGGFLRRYPKSYRDHGFTLIELAVVVLVVGLLIGSLLVPLSTQVDQRNITETQRRLEDAREALIGYAVATGRLPCPASSTSNGVEALTSGECSTSTATGIYDGFVPGVTLGLNNLDSSGYLIDAWPTNQSRIRYAVADIKLPPSSGGTPHALTTNNTPYAMRLAGINAIGATTSSPPGPYLIVCASATGIVTGVNPTCGPTSTNTVAGGNAVFVVYSLGKNGAATSGIDEAANTNGDRLFISKGFSSASAASFDDQLVWVSNYTLISRLIAAGMLP
jgi:prepilin-type N-terminal cleavage/methylation domain-containing protein